MSMPAHHRIAAFGCAVLSAFGVAAVHAAPVVTLSTGGFQSATASATAYGGGAFNAPNTLGDTRVSASPSAEVSEAAPGAGKVYTGVVGTYPSGGGGGTPLPGVSAGVDFSGTRNVAGAAPAPWSAYATAVTSAQTGRMEFEAAGVAYNQTPAGNQGMFAVSGASGMISNYFEAQFSREVAAELASVPQYLTLTATLMGHTTQPGQVGGRLRMVSDLRTSANLQEIAIDVQDTGDWTQQYQLQYAFTDLFDYPGDGNCLQQPGKPWVQCLSPLWVEASFALGSVAEEASTLSVLLSWSVPDTLLGLRTDAGSWGAPLAVDPPVQAVPEPGSAAMVVLGLGVLAAVQGLPRRRRSHGTAAPAVGTWAQGSVSAR